VDLLARFVSIGAVAPFYIFEFVIDEEKASESPMTPKEVQR